jgi:hypothetical protein
MFEQMNTQWMTLGKRFADTAMKAHGLAVEGFEKSLALQLKALEENVEATMSFFGDATAARDIDSAKTLMPRGMNLAKESAEKMIAVNQEVFALTMKTNESIGALYANDAEVAKQTFETQAKTVGAKVRKAAR